MDTAELKVMSESLTSLLGDTCMIKRGQYSQSTRQFSDPPYIMVVTLSTPFDVADQLTSPDPSIMNMLQSINISYEQYRQLTFPLDMDLRSNDRCYKLPISYTLKVYNADNADNVKFRIVVTKAQPLGGGPDAGLDTGPLPITITAADLKHELTTSGLYKETEIDVTGSDLNAGKYETGGFVITPLGDSFVAANAFGASLEFTRRVNPAPVIEMTLNKPVYELITMSVDESQPVLKIAHAQLARNARY